MTAFMNDHKKNKKANIARTLAWLLNEPDEEMAEALRKGEIYYFFFNCLKPLPRKVPDLDGFLPPGNGRDLLQQMKEEYERLFRDPQSGDLWWVESIHKAWTNDPECRLSHARDKGYVMGDPALHMMELYRSFGLEMPEGFSGMPDHIVLELEFLAHLYESYSEEETQTFIKDHLDWIPEMVKSGKKHAPPSFYLSLLEILETFIRSESGWIREEDTIYS
jgi:TorA maturation chaperone TorD